MRWKFFKVVVIYLFFQCITDDEFWVIYDGFMGEKDVRLRDVWKTVREKEKKTH